MINVTGIITLFADTDAKAENDVQGHITGKWKA